jgi:hypothetical protein
VSKFDWMEGTRLGKFDTQVECGMLVRLSSYLSQWLLVLGHIFT